MDIGSDMGIETWMKKLSVVNEMDTRSTGKIMEKKGKKPMKVGISEWVY